MSRVISLFLVVVLCLSLAVSVSAADTTSPFVNLLDTTTPDDSGSLVVAVPAGRWLTHNFKLPVAGTLYFVDFVVSAPDDIKAFVAVATDDWRSVSWSKIADGMWYGSVAIPGQDAHSIDIQLHSPSGGKCQFHSVNVSYQPYSAFDIKAETSLSGSNAPAVSDDYYLRTANRNISWVESIKRFDMVKVRLRTTGWTLGSFSGFVTGQFPVPVSVNAINSAPGGQVDMLIDLTVDLRNLDKSHMQDLIIQTVGKYQGQFGYTMNLVTAHGYIFTTIPDDTRGAISAIAYQVFQLNKVTGWIHNKLDSLVTFLKDTMQASIASIDVGVWKIKSTVDSILGAMSGAGNPELESESQQIQDGVDQIGGFESGYQSDISAKLPDLVSSVKPTDFLSRPSFGFLALVLNRFFSSNNYLTYYIYFSCFLGLFLYICSRAPGFKSRPHNK